MKDFRAQLKELPDKPGVYLMFNPEGEIIYVGKAINLKRRVSSYFTKSRKGKGPKVDAMVEHVDHFEFIVVDNEVEALVLESNFIKEHEPKYNILLRDDKQYPYICISKEKYPRILKVRQVKEDGAEYYGPYPNAYAVNDTIGLLQGIFKIRNCNLDFDRGQSLKRPCLNYFIDRCPGPCVGKADEDDYGSAVDGLRDFLKGKDKEIREILKAKMHEASEDLNYERAARFRDDLLNLDQLKEKQTVSFTGGKDYDAVAFAAGKSIICVQVLFIRRGKLVDREHFRMSELYREEPAEIVSSFLKQFYIKATYIPNEVLVDTYPEDGEGIEAFLTSKKGSRVSLHVPKRGEKKSIIDMAKSNAGMELTRIEKRIERRERNKDRGVIELENLLGLRDIDRIESYDISNISGAQNVGSMVVYRREKKENKEYRKFKIRTVDGADDYGSQREMLERRFDHGLKDRAEGKSGNTGFAQFPDLILMDGGRGQVGLAEEVLRERGLNIPVAGMVKDDRHTTRALYFRAKEIELDPRSKAYKFLYEVQEEVHRFAIAYHRKLRGKEMVRSELDQIKGIGRKRKTALLKAFGSIDAIKRADIGALTGVEGMNRKSAQNVFEYFNLKGGKDERTGTAEQDR